MEMMGWKANSRLLFLRDIFQPATVGLSRLRKATGRCPDLGTPPDFPEHGYTAEPCTRQNPDGWLWSDSAKRDGKRKWRDGRNAKTTEADPAQPLTEPGLAKERQG